MMSIELTQPRVPRDIQDPDYGREEYIDDCVERIMTTQKRVLITLGGMWDASKLPPVVRERFPGGFFPGYRLAKDEIVKRVHELGREVLVEEYRGGSNSDLLGIPYDSSWSLDGYYVSLVPKEQQQVGR
jgi:hypothetical protein